VDYFLVNVRFLVNFWLDWFERIYCSRRWIWEDEGYLVDLSWEDGWGEICRIRSSLIWWDLQGFEINIKITKLPL